MAAIKKIKHATLSKITRLTPGDFLCIVILINYHIMYLKINTGTFQVTEIPNKKELPPQQQYAGGHYEDIVLAIVGGRNTKNSKRFIETISIELFEMTTQSNLRGVSVQFNISECNKKIMNVVLKLGKEALQTPPEYIWAEKLLSRGPDLMIKVIEAIEEFYSGNEKIMHTPWTHGYFESESKGLEFKTWKNFMQKTGLFMP